MQLLWWRRRRVCSDDIQRGLRARLHVVLRTNLFVVLCTDVLGSLRSGLLVVLCAHVHRRICTDIHRELRWLKLVEWLLPRPVIWLDLELCSDIRRELRTSLLDMRLAVLDVFDMRRSVQ